MKFSERLPHSLEPSPFFTELEKIKKDVFENAKDEFIDLTISSPLKTGLPFDLQQAIEKTKNEFSIWENSPAGSLKARQAIAEYYRNRGKFFDEDNIILTASTSEAYSLLFKAFCNPHDTILTPLPGYPLLDTLAALEYLECYPYFLKLRYENKKFRFVLDEDSLLSAPENTKILLLVSPHNPTGHIVNEAEWKSITSFCKERDILLIVDEVFGDYAFSKNAKRTWEYGTPECAVVWLNGLSKIAGSPQLKLGWMVFDGPAEFLMRFGETLEYIADAYLSVSSMAQALAPEVLKESQNYEAKIIERLNENYEILRSSFNTKICPQISGGWYAALHFKNDDEELTLELLKKAHVLVQPGFFFDFFEDGWIIISLLQEVELFKEGIKRIKEFLNS